MKKIHHLYIESNEKSIEDIIIRLIKLLPKYLYITNNILYYNKNTNGKGTIIFQCLNSSEIIIIKFYQNPYNSIPEELLYLSEYYRNHYFYQNCYLAYCNHNEYDISIIKCKKADGDIHNLKMNIDEYNTLNENISDELYKMHLNGFVHMDIKTTNILYKKTKDGIIFGLCDFDLVNYTNFKINPIFKRYYYKLYKMEIPEIYTEELENDIFKHFLYLIKMNKKILANTV
jgi:hypothetical protein